MYKFSIKIFISILLFFPILCVSQDLIILENKDSINCKIIEDKITFLIYKYDNDTNTHIIHHKNYNFYIINHITETKDHSSKPSYNNQINIDNNIHSLINIGFGIGIDYGGLGTRLSVFPLTHISLFIAMGYNFNDVGTTFGTKIHYLSKTVSPSIGLMYGYNAVIVIPNYYSMTYYGVTFVSGLELRAKNKRNFINIEILAPKRSKEFKEDYKTFKNNLKNKPLPIMFSLGLHFGI